MSQHRETMARVKRDKENVNRLFRQKDFEGKKLVFIIAKTWGAARVFLQRTRNLNSNKLKVMFLTRREQLIGVDRKETIIIKLNRALETEGNASIIALAESRNISVVDFVVPEGV